MTVKLKSADHSTWDDTTFDVIEAVDTQFKVGCYGGTVERAHQENENVAQILGRLIETLHESHCLTDEQMLQVIGGSWEIVK